MLDEASRTGIETWVDLEAWLAGRPVGSEQLRRATE
jgi:hypothetical protein